MNVPKPQWAAYPGTDRLGRPLTNDESAALAKLLRAHDYPGARIVALNFAFKLTRSKERAKDLMGRVAERFVRLGWDPNEVSLVKRLCRLVWSEFTHQIEENDAEQRVMEAYLAEVSATMPRTAPSPEDLRAQEAKRRRDRAHAESELEKLRAHFDKAGDQVNLDWIKFSLQGEDDLQKMAELTHRTVEEFYRATDRRKRLVRRLLAEGRGVPYEEDDES